MTVSIATATYRDTYAGNVPVRLEQHGKGWLWCAPLGTMVTCGYRPTATAARAINNAKHDRRFSDVVEG